MTEFCLISVVCYSVLELFSKHLKEVGEAFNEVLSQQIKLLGGQICSDFEDKAKVDQQAKLQALSHLSTALVNVLDRILSNIERRFVAGKNALRHEMLLNGHTEDEIEMLWEAIHSLFLETDKWLQSLHKHLRLWERLLYLLTFFCFFSVFPNAFRHLCTTMPWTIWPSLVILWGVCWMFYGPSDNGEDDVAAQFAKATLSFEFPSDYDWDFSVDSTNTWQDFHADKQVSKVDMKFHGRRNSYEDVSLASAYSQHGQQHDEHTGLYTIDSARSFPGNATTFHGMRTLDQNESTSMLAGCNSNYLNITTFQASTPVLSVTNTPNQQPVGQNENTSRQSSSPNSTHPLPELTVLDTHNPGSKNTEAAKNTKHSQEVRYFCEEPGCKRQSEGFKRRDHLAQHLSGAHKRQLAGVRGTAGPTKVTQSAAGPSNSAVASSFQVPQSLALEKTLGKRRREDDLSPKDSEEVARLLAAERRRTQMLMAEMARMREQNRQEHEQRDTRERQLREEIGKLQDRYCALLGESA